MHPAQKDLNNLPDTLLVLAGGFGTRLKSVLGEVPKTLAPINGKPFLQYMIDYWVSGKISNLVFLLHYQAQAIIDFLQDYKKQLDSDIHIEYIWEESPLGTGGSLANAVKQLNLKKSFLATNSDTWLTRGLEEIRSTKAPAIVLVKVPDGNRFGAVKTDGDRVTSFEEKGSDSGPVWISAGLYHLKPEAFHEWNGKAFSIEADLFPRLAKNGELGAVPVEADFIDIGIPNDYARLAKLSKIELT